MRKSIIPIHEKALKLLAITTDLEPTLSKIDTFLQENDVLDYAINVTDLNNSVVVRISFLEAPKDRAKIHREVTHVMEAIGFTKMSGLAFHVFI